MAHIRTVSPGDAEGPLAAIYAAAVQRAGRVFNILRLQSLNPAALDASMRMYLAVMHGPSPLTRVERESIAVTVSRVNECFY
jgi:alkylhydroperoxidase family enzyme